MLVARLASCATVLIFAAQGCFAADLLPLKRGIFVEKPVGCENRSNATVISYWGNELNSNRVIGEIIKIERNGQKYEVTLEMNSMGEPSGKELWTLLIDNPKEMSVTAPGRGATYVWCSSQM